MLFVPELNAEGLPGLIVSFGFAKSFSFSFSFSLTIADSSDRSSLFSRSCAPAVVSCKSPDGCLELDRSAVCTSAGWVDFCGLRSFFFFRGVPSPELWRVSSPYDLGNLVRNLSLTCGPVLCPRLSSGSATILAHEKPCF